MWNVVLILRRILCVRFWLWAGLHDSQPGKEVASTSDSNLSAPNTFVSHRVAEVELSTKVILLSSEVILLWTKVILRAKTVRLHPNLKTNSEARKFASSDSVALAESQPTPDSLKICMFLSYVLIIVLIFTRQCNRMPIYIYQEK